MWIDEIENELPNGLHDATIEGLNIDLTNRSIVFVLAIDMSEVGGKGEYDYKRGTLEVSDFGFCDIEQPNNCEGKTFKNLRISSTGKIDELSKIQNGYQSYYFYIPFWNSFIKFSGKTAKLSWLKM